MSCYSEASCCLGNVLGSFDGKRFSCSVERFDVLDAFPEKVGLNWPELDLASAL